MTVTAKRTPVTRENAATRETRAYYSLTCTCNTKLLSRRLGSYRVQDGNKSSYGRESPACRVKHSRSNLLGTTRPDAAARLSHLGLRNET
jgi:hypothetical protein